MNREIDKDLLRRLSEGDYKAFDKIYLSYWKKLYAFAFKLSDSKEVSETLIQNIFMDLWEKRKTLKINNLEAYLFQSVKYQVYKSYHKKRMDLSMMEAQFESYIIDVLEEDDQEITGCLNRAIQMLPDKRRKVLIMSKLQGMKINEISEELDISSQTVKNQLSIAIKQLRLELKSISRYLSFL